MHTCGLILIAPAPAPPAPNVGLPLDQKHPDWVYSRAGLARNPLYIAELLENKLNQAVPYNNIIIAIAFWFKVSPFRVFQVENTQKWFYPSLPLGGALGLCSWPKATQAGFLCRRHHGGNQTPNLCLHRWCLRSRRFLNH